MKRTLVVILALLLVFSLFAGCGPKEPEVPAAAPTPSAQPSPELEKAAEVGYWTLSRVDSSDPERAMSEEDIETFKSVGLEIFIDLKEDGSGGIMMDEYAPLKWADGKLDLGSEEFNMTYSIKGEELHMVFEGDTYVFVRGEGEAPKVEPTAEPVDENPLDWWVGDWYGWWVVDSGYGEYADVEGYFWDCFAEIDVYDDESGHIRLWDQEGSSSDFFMDCDVSFGAGASEVGTMWAESGYFWDCPVEHADWNADPGAMGFELEDMIYIDYSYIDPNNSANRLDADIFLRPWGRNWDDLDYGYDEDWPYEDMMPLYYNEWYLPLLAMDSVMPESFGEGYEIIESNINYGTGEVLARGEWDECIVEVVGAEHFVDADGKDAIRVYYDFTNTSNDNTAALDIISLDVQQDGYTQIAAYADYGEEVAEYGSDYLEVRPGVTIRCVAEYSMKMSGGKLSMKFYDYWNDGSSFTVEFNPQDLPGRPPKWEQEQIVDPMWLAGASPEGNISDAYVAIDHVEIIEEYDGAYGMRFFIRYTNLLDEPYAFYWSSLYKAFQDGVELYTAWPAEEYKCTEDDMIYEEIGPGESIMVSVCYKLRNEQSPVEFEITDGWTDDVIGHVFELTWGG